MITGASDGIGAAAARAAARDGHRVVVVGRSPQKTAVVAAELGVPYHLADYSELAQVVRLAEELTGRYERIDVLANNAGGIFAERRVTGDGLEQTFQVNHLAGFLLTARLRPLLAASGARVVQTSSMAVRTVRRYDLDNVQFAAGYTPMKAYSYAKLENALFARELQRRADAEGITATAFHPGVIASNFGSTGRASFRWLYANPISRRVLATPEDGARRMLQLALAPEDAGWEPGGYHERNRPAALPARLHPDEAAAGLWNLSKQLLAERGFAV
ncbi:SDR family NAD(P)-dependent oxidoreductase [Phycicoccus endophyticus]|uniref:SDR family NAD(P)-dependent oxidoreductase n=1 Tax=Phycicoccus endophyticus TaxID=1690220 RepID=UPI001E478548|nr:SDR family NAD(P)-dependent oxidoreductase [Phycicoccus endophyticus]